MKLDRFVRLTVAVLLATAATSTAAQVAPPPLSAYGELPSLEDIAMSRSGKMAMLTSSGGKRVLVVLDPAMKPLSAMEVGDIKVRDLTWIGDEAIMVERSDTQDLGERFIADSAEFFNAMVVPVEGSSEVHTVFADDKSVLNAAFGSYGFRKIDGKWIGYFAGIPLQMGQTGQYYFAGGNPALYAVDMATNESRRITSPPLAEQYADWLIGPEGEVAATLTFNENSGAWELENEGGKEIASGSKPDGSAGLIGFSTDGEKVLYRISPEYGDSEYFQVPLAGGQAERIFTDFEVDISFYDRETSRLIGYVPEDDNEQGQPVFFDEAAQDTVGKVFAAFQNINGTMHGFTPDFGRILLSTDGNNDSGTWYLIDTTAGQASVIGHSRPQIRANQVGPISTIAYKAQDGLEIEAILTLPPGREARNLPVIVFPHGGPRAHDEADFDWWAQAFASRGYAVLQPNFRGSTGYGEEFLKAGNGEWGKKMQSDISDGMAYLAEQGIVDPTRACIMGASYGGYAAMAGITLQQGFYRCSVAVAGVSDLELFLSREYNESGSRELREEWLEMMGARDHLDDVSPRNFAARADAPILLIHGRDDTVVPFEQSAKMADALDDAGKPFRLVELNGEDHWLSRSDTRKQMLEAAMKFVQEHNPAE